MAIKLNLLPPELAIQGSVAKAAKFFKKLTVIALALFLIFTLGVVGFFVLSTYQFKGSRKEVDSLKEQIRLQQTTEQGVVLVKDRIAKIKLVKGLPSTQKDIENISSLFSSLPDDASVEDIGITSKKVDSSILFTSYPVLSDFLKKVSSSELYKAVTISSFNFSPLSGYLLSLRFLR